VGDKVQLMWATASAVIAFARQGHRRAGVVAKGCLIHASTTCSRWSGSGSQPWTWEELGLRVPERAKSSPQTRNETANKL